MIRMLLALVVVALGMVLVLQNGRHLPSDDAGTAEAIPAYRTPVQEAEEVKALLETQQALLEQRAERHRP